MTGPVVDIQCHNFNADDLPVRGFVQHVALHDSLLSPAVAGLLDLIVQKGAPGYDEEKARLDALLGMSTFGDRLEGVLPAPPMVDPLAQLELEVDTELRELEASGLDLVHYISADPLGRSRIGEEAIAAGEPVYVPLHSVDQIVA